jgi:predicted house-cleaning noncanonical NTP pyrophosphatase (MazG superfamily)
VTRVTYNKLVRDNIEAKIRGNGEECAIEVIADDKDFKLALQAKLLEEVAELNSADSREAWLQEYADVMVVLDALTQLEEISEAEIKTAMTENVERKGFFKSRHKLLWADAQDD